MGFYATLKMSREEGPNPHWIRAFALPLCRQKKVLYFYFSAHFL